MWKMWLIRNLWLLNTVAAVVFLIILIAMVI